METTKVKDRRRSEALILRCIMRGATILASFKGFFNMQDSKVDLTRYLGLSSHTKEPSLGNLLTQSFQVPRPGLEPALSSSEARTLTTKPSGHPLRICKNP